MTTLWAVGFIGTRRIKWTEKKQQVPPLRYAPVGMTISFRVEDFTRKIYKVTGSQDDKFGGGGFYWDSSDQMDLKETAVPPLRYAPVGMTISFRLEDFARKPIKSKALRMTILLRVGDAKTSVFSDFIVDRTS
jgi:hypothetical protein